jgi:hypothetical protein
MRQVVAELCVVLEVAGKPERAVEQRVEHEEADAAKQEPAGEIAALAPARGCATTRGAAAGGRERRGPSDDFVQLPEARRYRSA